MLCFSHTGLTPISSVKPASVMRLRIENPLTTSVMPVGIGFWVDVVTDSVNAARPIRERMPNAGTTSSMVSAPSHTVVADKP